ncbi:hypothetical protein CTI12_AA368010 [Artemisia annua]|uniref:KIB1-4 beta-propeller domain-containing protein n=1 Tax=Artemisia annua TaxID=35608 RepID=A0A2U1MKN8_ARTAN|nr:hypothetical protein CTI12_AA368010 [Artemisia annua]
MCVFMWVDPNHWRRLHYTTHQSLSREIINLPKVDTFPPEDPLDWDGSISQVVLLMESKLVLVMYDSPGEGKLGFCHIGDNRWKSVEQPLDNNIFDIIFYNRQVYVFESDKIQTCNVNGKHPSALVDVVMIPEDFHELNGHVGQRAPYMAGLDDGGDWSKVKDFGRKTLFVGFNSSFWTEDTTGVIKGNCIYYTEGGAKDTGIYHMSDGTIEPHFTGESCCDFTPLCESIIWLQSK